MPRRPVFISHSSRTPAARAFTEALCVGLNARGFEVWCDRTALRGGDDWRQTIRGWVNHCAAAIVLCSRDALGRSDWVAYEATILANRRDQYRAVELLPVLLDDVVAGDLDQGPLRVAQLLTSQYLRCDGDAGALIEAIAKRLGHLLRDADESPLARLTRAVALELALAYPSPRWRDGLEACWAALGQGPPDPGHPDPVKRFADALAGHLTAAGPGALSAFVTLLDGLRPPLPEAFARRLLDLLKGLWVDPTAAAGLRAAQHAPDHRAVALNGCFIPDFTGPCYVQRAWLPSHLFALIPVAGRTLAALKASIQAGLDQRRHGLRQVRNGQGPVLVLLPQPDAEQPGPLADAHLLGALRAAFPDLIFLVPTGPGLPLDAEATLGARPLLPALDLALESDQYDDWLCASERIHPQTAGY